MDTSIIIPFHNEEESCTRVISEIQTLYPHAEIIAINDGSTDNTGHLLSSIPRIKIIVFDKLKGQSAAIWEGLYKASREICVVMDGDGECDPRDIKNLVHALSYADFACGYRVKRKRSLANAMGSKIANTIRRKVTGDHARDTGAMKAVRKNHIKHLHFFDGIHRFIPAFLENAGLSVIEVPLRPRQRLGGTTKYTLGKRAINGIFDLYNVKKILMAKKNG